jgi:polysaccharide biosynthesis protein PslH
MNSLKTLVIAENLPYPAFKGGDLRNWQNINSLIHTSQVGVFGLCSNDRRRGKVPHHGIAFWRSSPDPALAYPPPQDQRLAARSWLLDPTGHPSDLYSDIAAAELISVMEEFKPQLVVVEGLWLHRYIDILQPYDCCIVLDSYNVETKVSEQRAAATGGDDLPSKLIRKILPDRTRVIEHKATHAVDQIWVCSTTDAQLMNELHQPRVPIHIVPNGIDVASYEEVRAGKYPSSKTVAASGHTLIFPAAFSYWPNITAATFLIESVFPRLAARFPDCHLLCVGSMPTPRMLEASQREPRIIVTGIVPDMRPYLAAASAMAVPLFEGGGTRFKILEAFAARIPVVSTTKGVEGLAVRDGEHLLIAESADEFTDAVQRLWTDGYLVNQLVSKGQALVEQSYSWDVIGQRIEKAVAELDLKIG